ncbi:MAG: hypothetical protein ACREFW_07640 [Rhizomicrobium sp.]
MQNKETRKFTFDTEFRGEADLVSEAARVRQKRTLTTREIEALCASARDKATEAASVRAVEDVERTIAAMVIAVRAALDQSRAEIEAIRTDVALIALSAARKIAFAAVAAAPAGEVEQALREAMRQALGEPRITLRAGPEAIAALEGRISAITHDEGYEGRVILAADPGCGGADCRIEWRGGGSERCREAIETALESLIARHLSNPPEAPKG